MKMRVKIDEQIFDVEIENLEERPIRVTVEGQTFEIWPEEEQETCEPAYTPPVPQLVVGSPASPVSAAIPTASSNSVKAPIPGVILAVHVKVGESVRAGQELCTLEAMKMKNAIRASRDGVIAAIHVQPGQTVQHGHALMDFSD